MVMREGRDRVSKVKLSVFKRVLTECLGVTNEKVFLIGDKGVGDRLFAPFITRSYALACEELGIPYEEYYQNVKTRGEPADPVLVRKLVRLPKRSVIIVNVSNRLGRMEALGLSFRGFARRQGHRFISASTLKGIKPQHFSVFMNALDIDYKAVQRRSKRLKRILDNGREVVVTSKAGTDVVVGIEGVEARRADGVYREPGSGGNLPGSEVYIAPAQKRVYGDVVIDGSVRVRNGTLLVRGAPVRMKVENGVVVSFNRTFEARQLEATLKWAHMKSEHPWGVRRVAELGIGLNPKARIIGATILDEKVLGTAHVALGSNHWFGGGVYSIIHLDQVMRNVTVKVDGRLVRP